MSRPSARKIVLLGLMGKNPVAGVVWQTVHYLLGFERLGFESYYVEAHASTPTMFCERPGDDGAAKVAAFLHAALGRFGLGDRWAFQALHSDGRTYGPLAPRLKDLFRSAAMVINLHGATEPLPAHYQAGRLVYLETDPVQLQIELYHNEPETVAFLEPHCAFFTFGENYGRPGCGLPVTDRFTFRPTRQPVVLDLWDPDDTPPGPAFTTIGNWRQLSREVSFGGEVYHWSKHFEFMKFLGLPGRTGQRFELALGKYDEEDRALLEREGWAVRHSLDFSTDCEAYRDYIVRSRGEFTVAKDQNVRLRSGWFSDRSATYLAAGRPVITQETGFSDLFPTGAGLFGFTTLDEIVGAVEKVNADYGAHSRAAAAIGREYFGSDTVLSRLVAEVGV
jgi:hypothetical protein